MAHSQQHSLVDLCLRLCLRLSTTNSSLDRTINKHASLRLNMEKQFSHSGLVVAFQLSLRRMFQCEMKKAKRVKHEFIKSVMLRMMGIQTE